MTFYKFSVGVVLAVAMVGTLGAASLAFSARDFQFGVAQIAPDTNGLIDFHRLAEADAQIAKLEAETAEPRGALLEIENALAAVDARVERANTDASAAAASIVGAVAPIEERAGIQGNVADTSAQALSQRVAAVAGRAGLSAADQQTIVGLQAQVQQLAQTETGGDAAEADRAALLARQRALGVQVEESNRRIYALQQSVVPNYQHYARVRGEAEALGTMSPLGVAAYLAQGHPALLSTTLVLLMGALGSLLYLFPAYLNRPEPVTMAEIVVRLIFGMCAALAVYVLANAAIAGFSMGSGVVQATTSSTLNPFTISLVGIVAGVLSEDIAKWIQDRGRGIFTQGGVSGAPRASTTPPPARSEPAPTGGLVNNEAIS
ncbi:MAG: hypothetical protein JNK94_07345 [Hyphomonadaceae bacterium]|nr:hypothetical protein [Hyphomonadaceae bacterium]